MSAFNPDDYELIEPEETEAKQETFNPDDYELINPDDYELIEPEEEAPKKYNRRAPGTNPINEPGTRDPREQLNPRAERETAPIDWDKLKHGTGEKFVNPSADWTHYAKLPIDRSNEVLANMVQGAGNIVYHGTNAITKEDTEGILKEYTDKASEWIEKDAFGAEAIHTPEKLKEAFTKEGVLSISAWSEVGNFIGETLATSIPDMGYMILNMPAYIMSRTEEIAETRVEEDGRKGDPTGKDLAIALPFATASALMEKLGLKATTSKIYTEIVDEIAGKSAKEATKIIIRKVRDGSVVELGTEAVEEGAIEPMGERIATKSEKPLIDVERGAFGALGGFGSGVVMSGTTATMTTAYEANPTVKRKKRDQLIADVIDQSSDMVTGAEATQAMSDMYLANMGATIEDDAEVIHPERAKYEAEREKVQSDFLALLEEYPDVTFPKEVLGNVQMQQQIINDMKPEALEESAEEAITQKEPTYAEIVQDEKKQEAKEEEALEEVNTYFEEQGKKGTPAHMDEQLRVNQELYGTDEDKLKEENAKIFKSKKLESEIKYKGMDEEQLKAEEEALEGNVELPPVAEKETITQIPKTDLTEPIADEMGVEIEDKITKVGAKLKEATAKGQGTTGLQKELQDLKGRLKAERAKEAEFKEKMQEVIKEKSEPMGSKSEEPFGAGFMGGTDTVSTKQEEILQAEKDAKGEPTGEAKETLIVENETLDYGTPKTAGELNPPSFSMNAMPDRPTGDKIKVGKEVVKMPKRVIFPTDAKEVFTDLVGERFYQGNLNSTKAGHYKIRGGEIRQQNLNDIAVTGHELLHFFKRQMNTPAIKRFYKNYKKELEKYSYDTNPRVVHEEGFAEFLRAYLTQSQYIIENSPGLYEEFEKALNEKQTDKEVISRTRPLISQVKKLKEELAELDPSQIEDKERIEKKIIERNRKIKDIKNTNKEMPGRIKKIKEIQKLSHFYYNQGAVAGNKSAIAPMETMIGNMKQNWSELTNKNINITKYLDIAHPIKVILKDLDIDDGYNAKNPYILTRLATGHTESVTEGIAKFGTARLTKDGSLEFSGEGLSEVFKPALEASGKPTRQSNNEILDDLYRFFQLVQAEYQMFQGKKTAFHPDNLKKEIKELRKRPGFVESHQKLMEFNTRMLDFYVDLSYITKEQAEQFEEDHPYYIPTHRVIAGSTTAGGKGGIKKRSKMGSERQLLPVDNVFAQLEKHISSALLAHAKSNLFKQLRDHPKGATWATHIKKRTERYQALIEQQARHMAEMLILEGMVLDDQNQLVPADDENPLMIGMQEEMTQRMTTNLIINPSLATFYTFGKEPISKDGNVYSVIIDGNQEFFEINKNTENGALLNEMFTGIDNAYEANLLMKAMHKIKNVMTRSIVALPDFILGNLFVDTTTAGIYTKTGFIPGVNSITGGTQVVRSGMANIDTSDADKDYRLFILNGGAFGTRVEMTTKENRKRQMLKSAINEKSIARFWGTYDRIVSVGEMATRMGEYSRAVKQGIDPLASAYLGVEITTDFNMHGSDKRVNALRSMVAFLPASINSIYKDYRELSGRDIHLSTIARKHFTQLAVRGFSIITIPAIISMLLSSEEEDESDLKTVQAEARYSYYEFGDFERKHKTQYLLGMIFEKAPKLVREAFIKDRGERAWEIASAGVWAMLVPDAVPTAVSPFLDIARNQRFTGAPITSRRLMALKGKEKYLRYTERTPEMYKATAKYLKSIGINASPLEMEHITKSYLGYVAKWIEDGTNRIMWDNERYGEKAYQSKGGVNMVLDHLANQFKYKDYGQTYWSHKYYDMRDKVMSEYAVYSQAKKLDKMGRSEDADELLGDMDIAKIKGSAKVLRKLDKRIGTLRAMEKKIEYDKTLNSKQKEAKLLKLRRDIGSIQQMGFKDFKDTIK